VEDYGSVKVNVIIPTGKELFELKNVAYIPGFYINVMSHKKLRQARYYWDDINLRVKRDNISETVFYVEEIHD
jgi:hypothetical protein